MMGSPSEAWYGGEWMIYYSIYDKMATLLASTSICITIIMTEYFVMFFSVAS